MNLLKKHLGKIIKFTFDVSSKEKKQWYIEFYHSKCNHDNRSGYAIGIQLGFKVIELIWAKDYYKPYKFNGLST